jgi:hypothetical protein
MKKIILAFLLFRSAEISAQTKITKFQVEGNCGMCKKNIEQAAVDAGADKAIWNKKTKELKIKFDAAKTSEDKIKKQIAEAGYSNPTYQANDSAYQKLPECCQYKSKNIKSH